MEEVYLSTAIIGMSVAIAAAIFLYLSKTRSKGAAASPKKLTVYGGIPLGPYADSSPACLKLMTYLKMCHESFDIVYFAEHGLKEAPKKKCPYVHWEKINGGCPLGDSTLIMNELLRWNPKAYNIDTHLTVEQRAVGTAFKIMLEESVYWYLVRVRWMSEEWHRVTVPTYFGYLPSTAWIRALQVRMLRRKILRDTQGQGIGLLDDGESVEKLRLEIQALSDFLGEKKYILGDRVSSYDATVFAFVVVFLQGGWQHEICDVVRGNKNLVSYVERMNAEFWPDLCAA